MVTHVMLDDEPLDTDGIPIAVKVLAAEMEKRKVVEKKKKVIKVPKSKPGDHQFTRIIPRDEWGALPPKPNHNMQPLEFPIVHIYFNLHHNWFICKNQEQCSETLKRMQMREMNENGICDVRHNFMIGNDGNVYEGRGWNYRPEVGHKLTKYWTSQTIDIGFFAECQDEFTPYEQMMKVGYEFVLHFIEAKRISPDWLRI